MFKKLKVNKILAFLLATVMIIPVITQMRAHAERLYLVTLECIIISR